MEQFKEQLENLERQQEEINNLSKKVQDQIDALKSSTTIPLEIATAIKARLEQDFVAGDSSSVGAGTHTQAVNEAGVASYSVAKPMTGFIEILFNGVTYNVPYY
jgi:hypothetical protein